MKKRFILAIFCVVAVGAVGAAFLAQTQPGKLAGLIQAGNRKAALDMIRAGADVNEAQPDGTRPIHWAVYRVDYEVLEALIAKKARANVTNELGSTPLAEAVKLSDARMVKMLLDAGSGPEGANPDGQTALMLAIKNGDLDIVQMLVNAGANVNAVEKVQDQTPLMWAGAATRNAGEMVKLLLSKGANVKASSKYTDWPSQMTSEPRAQYHSYGGLTPLLYAARSGCYACVEAMVGAGADVNIPNPEGVTPLMIALDNSHNDVAKFLMDHGANPKVWDVYGRTALYIAVDKKAAAGGGAGAGGGRGGAGGRGAGGAIPAVPAAGQPPAGAGGRGAAPAGQAAAGGRGAGGGRGGAGGAGGGAAGFGGRGGGGAAAAGPNVPSMEIINALLAAGVDPNPQLSARRPEAGSGGRFSDPLLSTGVTPLFRATMNNDMEVIRALLDKGASPNVYDMGLTPFLLAAGVENAFATCAASGRGGGGGGGRGGGGGAAAPNTALLDLFLEHGADINSQVSGRLSYSMRLSRNAGWPDIEGLTALHAAVQSGRTEMVRYLLDHGARTDLVDFSGRTVVDVANGAPTKPAPANFGTANIPAAVGTIVEDTALAAAGSNSAGAGRGRTCPPASPEIRTMVQNAAQNQKK